MSMAEAATLLAVVGGIVANMSALVAFRVSLEHRLTKLETMMKP